MRWPPFEHIFFDCDSTLTAVEGIDALADAAGKGWRVGVLTQAAMDGELELEEVYAKRLRAVKPTRGQITTIRQVYKQNVVEDAQGLIAALQALGHRVYIISGGLAEPVVDFGVFLGVPRENIRAVGVEYDRLSGDWWRSEHGEYPNTAERYLAFTNDNLTVSDGKARIVRDLLGEQGGRSLLIGDGHSDLMAGRTVDLFVGYGGVVSRPRVQAEAAAFIHSRSLAPLLAVAAGPGFLQRLRHSADLGPAGQVEAGGAGWRSLADKSLHLIETGAITFRDEQLSKKFHDAYKAVYSRTH